jgi:ankyrin repeat protein
MLLQHDSDLHIRDANEMTPLDLADKSGHAKCVALLKEAAGECFMSIICIYCLFYLRGDQEGLFKLVTLDRILNRITGVISGCWWLVVVNAIPISDICQINQQNISSCSVINNRIKKFSQLYCQLKQSFLITRYINTGVYNMSVTVTTMEN